eukprot:356232-Chlamydomonas_euryale.AAC.35
MSSADQLSQAPYTCYERCGAGQHVLRGFQKSFRQHKPTAYLSHNLSPCCMSSTALPPSAWLLNNLTKTTAYPHSPSEIQP